MKKFYYSKEGKTIIYQIGKYLYTIKGKPVAFLSEGAGPIPPIHEIPPIPAIPSIPPIPPVPPVPSFNWSSIRAEDFFVN
jgi:hypothetical protein